jgi:hypothetical protein
MSLGGGAGQEESKSSITYKDNTSPDSPMAFFDEPNRKVLIISNEQKENDKGGMMNGSGQKIKHTISWDEDTNPKDIETAIEEVLQKVKAAEAGGATQVINKAT